MKYQSLISIIDNDNDNFMLPKKSITKILI